MTRASYTDDELAGGFPLFFMDIYWSGQVFRFSKFAMELESDEDVIQYTSNLLDFAYRESAEFLGQDVEANLVSASVIFNEINLLEEWSIGNVLEGSRAQFCYVVYKEGRPQQKWEDRIVLIDGLVQEPQFGDPGNVEGFCTLSVEVGAVNEKRLLLDPGLVIDDRFPTPPSSLLGPDPETSIGKSWPIIIGSPSGINNYATPAYNIERPTSGIITGSLMMIAGHAVSATSIPIQDDQQRTVTKTISILEDIYNNTYSYIALQATDTIAQPGNDAYVTSADGSFESVGSTREMWTGLPTGGTIAMRNPFGTGDLEYAGDVCRWALHKSQTKADYGAWAALTPFLNQYRLAGYINDGEVSAWEWLAGNILPLLPVTVRSGANGLRPVLNDLHAMTWVQPIIEIKIGTDEEFGQLGPIETYRTTGELFSSFTLHYAKTGFDQRYESSCTVGATDVNNSIPSEYGMISESRYGASSFAMSTDYVYDQGTAEKIALGKLRANALPIRTLEISAPFYYGYLQIGDIIGATADRLFLQDHLMMVIEKEWENGSWRLKLAFEDNPIQNQRIS